MSTKSFTLIEIILVVGIVFLLASMSIVSLLRCRINSQQALATVSLRAIISAEIQHRVTNPNYVSLSSLGDYIDSNLASGNKEGYIFTATPVVGNENNQFFATAMPESLILNSAHTFYTDESGILCMSNSTGANAPSSHASGGGCPANFSVAQ